MSASGIISVIPARNPRFEMKIAPQSLPACEGDAPKQTPIRKKTLQAGRCRTMIGGWMKFVVVTNEAS